MNKVSRPKSRDLQFDVWIEPDGSYQADQAKLCVLMDIRDELKELNRLLNCQKFLSIPDKLESIRRNTKKPRKRKSKR